MKTWDPERPFGHLSTQGRDDLLAASVLLKGNQDNQPIVDGELDNLIDLSAERRIRILVSMCEAPSALCQLSHTTIHHVIYVDSEQLVRGLALRSLWIASRNDELRNCVDECTAAILVRQYSLTNPESVRMVTEMWLDGLAMIAEEVERSPHKPEQGLSLSRYEAQLARVLLIDVDSCDSTKIQRALEGLKHLPAPPDELVPKCLQLLKCGNNPRIMLLAISNLVRHRRKSDWSEINRELGIIIANESNPVWLRETAYHSLMTMNVRDSSTWPLLAIEEFRFPDDVDWNLVKQLCEN